MVDWLPMMSCAALHSAAVASASRAFSSAFASTSGRSGGEAAAHSLAALPARVRAFINGERLNPALTQLAAIDAGAQDRSAVHEARAIYQRRIAAIQRELLRDRADLSNAQMSAPRFVALCNGLLSSNGGRVRPQASCTAPLSPLQICVKISAWLTFYMNLRGCRPHATPCHTQLVVTQQGASIYRVLQQLGPFMSCRYSYMPAVRRSSRLDLALCPHLPAVRRGLTILEQLWFVLFEEGKRCNGTFSAE